MRSLAITIGSLVTMALTSCAVDAPDIGVDSEQVSAARQAYTGGTCKTPLDGTLVCNFAGQASGTYTDIAVAKDWNNMFLIRNDGVMHQYTIGSCSNPTTISGYNYTSADFVDGGGWGLVAVSNASRKVLVNAQNGAGANAIDYPADLPASVVRVAGYNSGNQLVVWVVYKRPPAYQPLDYRRLTYNWSTATWDPPVACGAYYYSGLSANGSRLMSLYTYSSQAITYRFHRLTRAAGPTCTATSEVFTGGATEHCYRVGTVNDEINGDFDYSASDAKYYVLDRFINGTTPGSPSTDAVVTIPNSGVVF